MSLAQKCRAVFPYFICVCSWKHAFYCAFKEQMLGQCLKHITRVLKNVFSTLKGKKKKRIHNNEFSLPVCIFKEYFNHWGTSQLLPLNYCSHSQGRPKPFWTHRSYCKLTQTVIHIGLSSLQTSLECLCSHWLSKQHRNGHVSIVGLGEDEAQRQVSAQQSQLQGQWAGRDEKAEAVLSPWGNCRWISRDPKMSGWNRWSRVRNWVQFCVGWPRRVITQGNGAVGWARPAGGCIKVTSLLAHTWQPLAAFDCMQPWVRLEQFPARGGKVPHLISWERVYGGEKIAGRQPAVKSVELK